MPGRNVQQKLGTAHGSPRRSRTAKASRISRIVGEIAMCPRVGRMGLNKALMARDRRTRIGARAPGAESNPHSKAAHRGVVGPAQNGITESDYEMREGQMQTRRPPSNAGSRLKRWVHWEGAV